MPAKPTEKGDKTAKGAKTAKGTEAAKGAKSGLEPRTLRILILIATGLVAALTVYLIWPEPPIDPKQPSTWPVSEEKAVVLASGLGRNCPRNHLWWILTGTPWRDAGTWQKPGAGGADFSDGSLITLSAAGTLCVRAARDLAEIQKVGRGAEEAPNSALYLSVTPKQGACPSETNYTTADYCLVETPLPPAPDIEP
jgi:hypothetical protein